MLTHRLSRGSRHSHWVPFPKKDHQDSDRGLKLWSERPLRNDQFTEELDRVCTKLIGTRGGPPTKDRPLAFVLD